MKTNKKDPKVKLDAYRYRAMGKMPKAIECFQAYLKIIPKDFVAALDLGELFMMQEQFPEACKVYAKILEFDPKHVIAASNLGGALLRSGRANDAKDLLLYALELDPKNVHARINLGGAYQTLGDRKANLDNALQAVGLDPSNALAFNNLGSALTDMAMFKEAKHAYETAVMLDPKQVDALINLAATEARLGEPARSAEMYEKVLTLLPPQEKMRADAVKFYAAFEYLKQGKLEKGWEYYDGGFSLLVPLAGARSPRRTFDAPRWDGQPLNGKTLLVWREQGLGDELLFYTCLHELKDMGGKVIVECDKRLVEVMARSFPEFTIRAEIFLPQQEGRSPFADFDYHLPAGSLMRHFRPTIESFNRSGAYIKPDPAKVAKFQERLAPYKDDYRLVGICWRSGKLDPVRNLSYTMLDEWGEVLQTPGFKFVNLQYGECETELKEAEEKYGIEILRWPDLNLRNDLDDIFALMTCLDAVASVQTAVLTMAGCAGVSSIGIKAGGWTLFSRRKENPWFRNLVNVNEGPNHIGEGILTLGVTSLVDVNSSEFEGPEENPNFLLDSRVLEIIRSSEDRIIQFLRPKFDVDRFEKILSLEEIDRELETFLDASCLRPSTIRKLYPYLLLGPNKTRLFNWLNRKELVEKISSNIDAMYLCLSYCFEENCRLQIPELIESLYSRNKNYKHFGNFTARFLLGMGERTIAANCLAMDIKHNRVFKGHLKRTEFAYLLHQEKDEEAVMEYLITILQKSQDKELKNSALSIILMIESWSKALIFNDRLFYLEAMVSTDQKLIFPRKKSIIIGQISLEERYALALEAPSFENILDFIISAYRARRKFDLDKLIKLNQTFALATNLYSNTHISTRFKFLRSKEAVYVSDVIYKFSRKQWTMLPESNPVLLYDLIEGVSTGVFKPYEKFTDCLFSLNERTWLTDIVSGEYA